MRNISRQRGCEALLVRSAQAGSQRAFDILYRSYNPALIRFASRLCGDPQLALDAVQDAWLTIARNLHDLDNPYAFRARAFRAVRWRCTDYLRQRERQHVQLQDEPVDPGADTSGMDATSRQIHKLIEQLPEIDKQAVYLFYLGDMTISELASVLEVPRGTIKSRLNRARNSLRKLIEGETHDND